MRKQHFIVISLLCMLFMIGTMTAFPYMVYANTEKKTEENSIYEALKERMDTAWNQGMDQVEEIEPIEIPGNFAERVLRSIASMLFRNLKAIKAGALLIGMVSFFLGGVTALLAKKDKKIQKKAIGVCMTIIPGLLLTLVFGISWFVSMFR